MITNIEDLLAEEFNLRHLIQHTTLDLLDDPKANKDDLIAAVLKGIDMWKMRMIMEIIEPYTNTKGKDVK